MNFQSKLLTLEELIRIEQQSRTEYSRDYVPGVIEPSFGIGRIL
jgi:glycyl-tRNA synthetase (class II)